MVPYTNTVPSHAMNPSWPWWGARSREEAEGGSDLRLHTC